MTASLPPQHDIGAFFDDYVRRVFPARRAQAGDVWHWPGDEWADVALREATFALLMGDVDVATVCDVVEIGPGSGKYTQMILERTPATVTAYEISEAFLASLAERCGDASATGRLVACHTAWTDNRKLLAMQCERAASVDLFFAIDVFLMMDFQSVLTYLISASALLRQGGRFFATFGDGTSDSGWARMLRDTGRHSAFDSSPSTRFHWVDPALIRSVLTRLGFDAIDIVRGPDGGLDIARLYVSAEMATPLPISEAERLLTPTGDSTNRPARDEQGR